MDRMIELLVALHDGLRRVGPGSTECTLRSLAFCRDLPPAPDILDVGCGTGAQTLALAFATGGAIVATDLVSAFLSRLRETASETGLGPRIRIIAADMGRLPFADDSFDLIWSEGAAYVMGFDNALSQWRSLARPGGYLVVSDLCWFRSDPPAEIRDFWESHYPAMRDVEANLAAVSNAGWRCVGHFHLPPEAWTDYYGPLRERLPEFRRIYSADVEAQMLADLTEREMSLMGRYADVCGYELFALRRDA